MVEVHLVLHELDDGEQQLGVAQPAEDVLEEAEVLPLHVAGDAVREGGEHHQRRVGELFLDAPPDVERVGIVGTGHADYQLEAHLLQHLRGLLLRTHLCEAWRVAQAQAGVLLEEFLVDAAVVLEHEGIVGVGYQEHVEHATRHQVYKRGVLQEGIELCQVLFHRAF